MSVAATVIGVALTVTEPKRKAELLKALDDKADELGIAVREEETAAL